MICPYCQAANEADATFCTSCGVTMTLQPQSRAVTPPPIYGQPYAAAAPAPAPSAPVSEIEALNYSRYVDLLCAGQSFLAQLAIRFYYVTGLKSYLVTHHDSFVVPNLRRDAAETIARIKQEMDGLGYQELMTTFLYMRTEHIQTLPYLSRSMIRDQAGVIPGANLFGLLIGGALLAAEIFLGVFLLLFDLAKLIFRVTVQQAGGAVRAVGRNGHDEMLAGNRLLLASTYRHTRTYAYVRDVGPETYVGWFTHHEPMTRGVELFLLTAAFLIFGFIAGVGAGVPFLALFGIAAGIALTCWFAPWLLNRLGALPQPRYISAVMGVISGLVLVVAGLGMMNTFADPDRIFRNISYGQTVDPFLTILIVAVISANYLLFSVAVITFLRACWSPVWHFDQFDAETHANIVKQRIGMILAEYLEAAGYTQSEINDILSGNNPGAGRYRRGRI